MNKRKLQINQVKKLALRGKKHKTITTKYEVALSYFKQKQQNLKIFNIGFEPLIVDLLDQLTNVQLAYKLQNSIKQQIQPVETSEDQLKFEGPCFKYISKQFPIDQLMKCISIKKDVKSNVVSLQILKNKHTLFFKHIRGIYPQFCICVGEKIIVEMYDLKVQWAKLNERGRMRMVQKIQKLICRSLYFIGTLIQNNIFAQIQEQQRKKKQQNTDLGTKSEKKRNVKGISQQVSSTYSFGSTDMLSNFSYGLKSQQSYQQDYYKSGYSQKSQKIVRKQRCILFQKVQIKNLSVKLPIEHNISNIVNSDQNRFEIDLLSNDVQNILIEQAFKIQKLKDACQRNKFDMNNPYSYEMYLNNMNSMNMNYYPSSSSSSSFYSPYQNYQQNVQQAQSYQNSYVYHNYYHGNYHNAGHQGHLGGSNTNINTNITNTAQDSDLYNLRRSFNFTNLVQTRKTHSRMGGNKYS